jgi:hypothetical protein
VQALLGQREEWGPELWQAYQEDPWGEKTEAALMDALAYRWGEHTDANLRLAQEVVQTYAPPEILDYLDESGAGNDPTLIMFLYRIGAAIEAAKKGEEFPVGPEPKGQAAAKIEEQIEDLMADEAYFNPDHPKHQGVVKKVTALFRKRYPEQA